MIFKPPHKNIQVWMKQRGQKSSTFGIRTYLDPHHSKDKQALENIQKFGGRAITQRWSNDYNSLCTSLNLKLLSTRRRIQKFKLCYKIANNLMHPCQYSHPSSSSVTRLHHSKPLLVPFVSTITHKSSFL